MYVVDPKLKEWATERQSEIIDTLNSVGTVRGASRKLGLQPSYIRAAVKAVKRRAILQGYSPTHDMTKATGRGAICALLFNIRTSVRLSVIVVTWQCSSITAGCSAVLVQVV